MRDIGRHNGQNIGRYNGRNISAIFVSNGLSAGTVLSAEIAIIGRNSHFRPEIPHSMLILHFLQKFDGSNVVMEYAKMVLV